MTRVIHTGDTHLGYRQYHQPERREDFLAAFRQVAADAVEMDVDAVVHAGDLFHDRRPGLPDLLGTMGILETLADAGIPFLAVVGNHETKRDAQWLDLFEAMGLATRLGDSPVVIGDTAFYGLDFVPRAKRDDIEYEFEPHDAEYAALVSHGLFQPLVPDYGNVEWDAAEVLSSANLAFDAMLLGDEHAATKQEVEGTWVAYCGSTERASASERDERGYNLVEFGGDDVRITRRGIETRDFVFLDLELAESEGFERIRERLREHDLEGAVVHVSIDGGGEDVSAARVESFATEEGALVARVNDRRELREETDFEVAFADPDEAVRERVSELGLSDAARDLDETIRASKVADTNVTDEVERRVGELLDDPDAFESAPATEPETVADRLADDETDGKVEDETENGDETTESAENDGTNESGESDTTDTSAGSEESDEASEPDDDDPATESDDGDVDEADRTAEPDGSDSSASGESTASTEAADDEPDKEETAAPAADGDGQASMEDYL